jgi:hypothetical protein
MTNELLIRALVADARPVRRLPPPEVRCVRWLGLALALTVTAALQFDLRADLAYLLGAHPLFSIDVACLLLLGLLSARSAFLLSVPAPRSSSTLALPLAGFALWLVLLASQLALPGALQPGTGWACVLRIAGLGAPALFTCWLLLRGAAPLAPGCAGLFMALASFSFSALASRLLCARDGALHLLLWHGLPVLVLAGLTALVARRFLRRAVASR